MLLISKMFLNFIWKMFHQSHIMMLGSVFLFLFELISKETQSLSTRFQNVWACVIINKYLGMFNDLWFKIPFIKKKLLYINIKLNKNVCLEHLPCTVHVGTSKEEMYALFIAYVYSCAMNNTHIYIVYCSFSTLHKIILNTC